MKTYYDITVDLYDLYPLKKIEAQQNNIGRGARITLTAGGLVLGLDGESVTMWAKKPDGTVSYLSCSVVDGKIQADFTSQMLAVPGDVQVELRLVNGEENITTPIFSVHVRKSNIDDSAAESTNEFTALASMVAEVNEMKKTALKGDPGEAATLEIGTVEASEPGSAPSVTNSGTAQEAILNFILPRGQTGPEGPAGQTQIHFSAAAEFPAAGNSTMLYVDNTVSPAIIYTWTGNAYVQASADISTVMAMLATPYDPDQDYTAGQYVTYNKQYWKFTATKSAGEWDASKAVATNVGTEISALNAKLSIKGSNQRVYGEADCSTGGEKRLASLSLKAGHTYMLIGETETNNGNTITTSCGTGILSGTAEYFPLPISRVTTGQGQGCNIVTVIKCTTDCVVYLYGYVYNPGSYKYQGNLISILLD